MYERTKEIIQDEGVVPFLSATVAFMSNKYEYSVAARYQYAKRKVRYPASTPKRYDLITVSPQSINSIIVPILYEKMDIRQFDTNVVGGTWDKQYSEKTLPFQGKLDGFRTIEIIALENYEFYNSVATHFEQDVPWEQTPIYEYFFSQVESKNDSRRYGTPQKIERQLRHLDELYEDMAELGYLRQKQLINQSSESPFVRRSTPHPNHHEVVISIGRDGTMFLTDGRHRFTVARILDIPEIPVRVLVRHTKWQEMRERIAAAEQLSELSSEYKQYADHPDMTDLL